MIPTPTKSRNRRPTKIPATFVGMLVDGLSDREIAAKLGVHRSTIAEWSARPDIRAMVDQSQAEFVAEVRRRGKSLLVRAVDAIDEALCAPAKCECGRVVIDHRTRIAAATFAADRMGLPKREILEHDASAICGKSDDELEVDILTDAIDILESRGQPLAAQAIRTAMGVKAA